MRTKSIKSLCVCLLAFAGTVAVYAQTTGSIAGIVVDANRAVIPGWGFSRDGKELYYSTGPLNHNVVMFTLER